MIYPFVAPDRHARATGGVRRRLTLGLLVALLVAGVAPRAMAHAAMGAQRLPANSVTLNFWIAPEGTHDDQTYQKMFPGFHKLHPEVKAINMTITPFANVAQKELAAFSAGKGPDVISTGNDFFAPLVTQGDLISLDDRIGQIKDQLEPGVWPLIEIDGHVYGVPVDLTSWVLLYNKNELSQASISHPPQTWAELQADAIKLTKKDAHGNVTQWGFGIPSTFPYFVNYATAPLWQAGAQLLNKSETAATFDSPAGVRGLQFIVDLYQKYHVAAPFGLYPAGAEQTAFWRGKIAMEIAGPDQVMLAQTQYPHFPLGVTFNPKGPAGSL
jgi:ABC-type glycerol-3-phosphate transport system substrate-binding protein